VRGIRRITALAILAGLLGLPLLALAGPAPCCAGDSPCAPGGAPCASLGPVPCCSADQGASSAAESRAAVTPVALVQPLVRLLAPPTRARAFEPASPPAAASPLELSVVLRL
jgi:hypothetical protein